MKKRFELAIFLIANLAMTTPALPCSTVSIPQSRHHIVAKSYDFDIGRGLIMVNKRNVAKQALLPAAGLTPAQWTAKYGSITFNQFGRELPLGGLNEAGLVVEIMWLNGTKYPDPSPDKPALSEAQWIQYQLDNYATVAEMVNHAQDVNIVPFAVPVHYMACDASAACATFEALNGQFVIHSGNDLKVDDYSVGVLTNSPYADSIETLKDYNSFGGAKPLPTGISSLDRFVRGASLARSFQPKTEIVKDFAFQILDRIEQPGFTKWQIVYDPVAKRIFFRSKTQMAEKSLSMDQFDFSCIRPVQILDVNQAEGGSANQRFTDYTTQANLDLILATYRVLPGNLPESLARQVALYPEGATHCVE